MAGTEQSGNVERLIVRAAGVRPIREPAANGQCTRCWHADHGAFGLPCPEVIITTYGTGTSSTARFCGCPPEGLG